MKTIEFEPTDKLRVSDINVRKHVVLALCDLGVFRLTGKETHQYYWQGYSYYDVMFTHCRSRKQAFREMRKYDNDVKFIVITEDDFNV